MTSPDSGALSAPYENVVDGAHPTQREPPPGLYYNRVGGMLKVNMGNVRSGGFAGEDVDGGDSAVGGADVDLDVLAEFVEEMEEAFDGESGESAAEEGGDFGLVDAEFFGGLGLGQAGGFD